MPSSSMTIDPELDAEWTVGDFSLISSDGVIFKVDTHVLLGASAVFRDMPGLMHGERKLEFAEPVIECAAVLRSFLDLITKGTVTPDRLNYFPDLCTFLWTFCDKYDCHVAARLLVALIKTSAWVQSEGVSLVDVFSIGAMSGDVELCTAALKLGCEQFKAKLKEPTAPHSEPVMCWAAHNKFVSRLSWSRAYSQALVTVRDLSLETFLRCPPEYTWALYRATSEPTTMSDITFKELVLVAKGHTSSAEWTPPCPEPTIHKLWTEGDVELISSDKVSFYVQSALINVASAVLSSRLRKTPDCIRFEDRQVESSEVISRFLTLVETGKVEELPLVEGSIPHGVALGVFLQRYECHMGKHIFSLQLRLSRNLRIQSLLIAAVMDDRKLGASLIASADKNKTVWTLRNCPEKSGCTVQPKKGVDVFDPLSWSFAMWRLMPPSWMHAICLSHDSTDNSVDAAKTFYNWLSFPEYEGIGDNIYQDEDQDPGDKSYDAKVADVAVMENDVVNESKGIEGNDADVVMDEDEQDPAETSTSETSKSKQPKSEPFLFFQVEEYTVHHIDFDTDKSYVPDSDNESESDPESDPEAEEYDSEPTIPSFSMYE